ncbi:CD1375 family protein [Brevibacillus laterosporus]|nr:CD1375 family protein [Brevibacillus laterosporus]MCR8939356.1 CD1375 family protein [Brevibacillus laterosporus]MCZ0841996.1 CD1375 family protein [Brevibacillus laterosporus]MCZ0845949.1 CD1375 family protein [Brevibacillus laterosporus]MED1909645.1 CD1375 family protein [Brevibacillus laterosporus]
MNPFAKIYCDLIKSGLKKVDDVPMKVRSDVEKILAEK